MSALTDYVEQRNRFNAIFGKAPLSLAIAADRQKIANSLEADLSPENLTCDGEVRGKALQDKANYLYRCARELTSIDSTLTMECL